MHSRLQILFAGLIPWAVHGQADSAGTSQHTSTANVTQDKHPANAFGNGKKKRKKKIKEKSKKKIQKENSKKKKKENSVCAVSESRSAAITFQSYPAAFKEHHGNHNCTCHRIAELAVFRRLNSEVLQQSEQSNKLTCSLQTAASHL